MLPMRPCSACGFEHPEGVVICPSTQQVIGTAVVGGRYRLDRLIAVGGIGAVYDARALHIDRRVAVKRLLPVYTSDPEVVRRFQREARAAGRIEHPNVVEVLDFGVGEDGVPFLVMEFLEGDTLAAKLEQAPGQRLPYDELLPLVLDVLEALGHAHSRGIIHRDLKPENIFIAHKPNGATVIKLVDLGISKALGSTSQAITQSGSALGTPHYMAPEQLRGEKDVDGRVDLYAMGIVMYRALSGAFPFDGRTFEHLVTRILDGTCAPLSSIVPGLPTGLSDAVAWTMNKDREQRAPSAEALAATLAPFSPAPAITPAPPRVSSVPPGHGASRTSHPSAPVSLAVAPVTPVRTTGPTLEGTTARRPSTLPESLLGEVQGEAFQISATLPSVAAQSQPPSRSSRLWLVLLLVAVVLAAAAVGSYLLLRTEDQAPPRAHPPSGGLAGSQLGPAPEQGDAATTTDDVAGGTADDATTATSDDAGGPGEAGAATSTDGAATAPPPTIDATPVAPVDGGPPPRETTEARVSDVGADRATVEARADTAPVDPGHVDAADEGSSSPEPLSPADVARLFQQLDVAVRACAGDEGPGFYRISVVARGSDGHVTETRVVSELSGESVECVRRLVADLAFPPFGEGTSSLGYRFEIPGTAAADAGTPAPDGRSFEQQVLDILRPARRRALACLAEGTAPPTLVVAIDGTAHRASLERVAGTVTAEEEACLREVVETTEVPAFITESSSGVRLPLR
ncbi:MAG: protein kinase [Deltaproteobacteria bacterium]|nr:protein kinase [Deltaproteobacteria bacterium]